MLHNKLKNLNNKYYIENFKIFESDNMDKPMICEEKYDKILHYTDYSFPLVAKIENFYFKLDKTERINKSQRMYIPGNYKNKFKAHPPESKNVLILSEKTRSLKDYMGFRI